MADDGDGGDGWTGAREEIRLACVFNGGVSLAVWMGGVAHEFNEFTAGGATYGPLLRLLGVQARADVITGTSAGGINGAALALAQVNRATNLTDLRRVWGEQGRLETLLNKPYRGDPVSVLRGEEVFLPELTRALHRLATPWQPRSVDERPVDLTVTTTLLDGVTLRDTDSFGQPLGQDRHDAYFRFARTTDGAGRVRDDFSADDDAPPAPQPDVLAALGLAARASAGFPFAFEPTLIPVDATAPATDRPDMARYASWRGDRTPGPAARPDRSRYAVDGGLLNNTPTQHALAAIEQMRAGLAVDRVMMLVIPLPSEEVVEAGATVATAPSLTAMIGGLGASVASTGNRTFVDDVVEHNRRATSVRGTRHDVLAAADDGEGLHDTAARLYPHYRRLRLRRDARDLAAQPALSVGLAYDQVRADLEAVQAELDASGLGLDVLPSSLEDLLTSGATPGPWPWGSKPLVDVGAAVLEYLARLVEAWPEADRGPVLAARAGVHDALARVRLVRCALDDAWREVTALATARPDRSYWRLRLSADAWLLGGAQDAYEHLSSAARTMGLDPAATLQPVLTALHAGRPGPVPSLADAGGLAGGLLGQALTTMLESVIGPTRPGTAARNGAALTAVIDEVWHPVLDAARTPEPARARRRVWQVLACLHVAAWTIGDELPTENTNPMRLTQVSAATRSDFATFSQTVGEKLGGASLARFSGFLKRSWRMNDWAWGRFDGASALLRVLLTPRRVREVAVGRGLSRPEDVVDLLLRTAWGPEAAAVVIAATSAGESSTAVPGPVRLVALRARAAHEVAVALRATVPVEMREGTEEADAPAMPGLTALLAYGRHVSIVHEELPEIADAVREDDADGANPRSRGRLFLTQHADLLQALATTREQPGTAAWLGNGLGALAAFDRAGIGREPLEAEAASDQLIRTAVTAAAVTATVVSGRRSGLGVLSPVTRAVKGLTMVPYWVTQGLTSGGLVARSLGLLGIAAGGVLLTLALLGLLDGALAGIGATLGAGAFLTALTYGAMRTGSHLHAVVLMAAAAALVAIGISATRGRWELSLGTGAVVGAVILVGGMMLLGSLREPMASPKVTVEDAAVSLVRRLRGTRWTDRAIGAVRAGGLVVVIVLVAAVVVVLVATGADRLDRLPDWFASRFTGPAAPWLLGAGVALLAALATIGVLLASRGLRRWQRENGTWRRERSSGSAGVAAGWSVVYGAVALLGCAVVLRWWPEGETVTWQAGWVVAVLAIFAAVLLAPVPLVILWRAHRQVGRRVRAALKRVDLRDEHGDPAVRHAAWLEANGWAYASVVRVVPDGGAGRLELRPHLTRTPAGASGGPSSPGV